MMERKKILAVIEEIGDISTSGAIVNFNLCNVLSKKYEVDILTLDSIDPSIVKKYEGGQMFLLPKNNLSYFQKLIIKIPVKKLYPIIAFLLGNDFLHHNRIKNIKTFLNQNGENYNTIIFLSAGLGFTPHHSLYKNLNVNTIGVYHDPYPISCYPEAFKYGKKWTEYFKIKHQQKSFNILNYLIFPSLRLYEWYLNDYKIDYKKILIIPHAVNFEKIANQSLTTETIKIVHTGTLLKPRNPKTFIKVFKELEMDSKMNLSFYGVVNNQVMQEVENLISNSNIHFYNNRFEYNFALNQLHSSDFQLLIESDAKDNPFLPTKFVDYVNVGKIIIALSPKTSEIARLLGEDYPFICDLNDENGIKEILKNKIFDSNCINLAQSKIDSLQGYFSEDFILKQYEKMIDSK